MVQSTPQHKPNYEAGWVMPSSCASVSSLPRLTVMGVCSGLEMWGICSKTGIYWRSYGISETDQHWDRRQLLLSKLQPFWGCTLVLHMNLIICKLQACFTAQWIETGKKWQWWVEGAGSRVPYLWDNTFQHLHSQAWISNIPRVLIFRPWQEVSIFTPLLKKSDLKALVL